MQQLDMFCQSDNDYLVTRITELQTQLVKTQKSLFKRVSELQKKAEKDIGFLEIQIEDLMHQYIQIFADDHTA